MGSSKEQAISVSQFEQEAAKKHVNPQKRTFNSLPTEIRIKILREIDTGDLYKLKCVCKQWNVLISANLVIAKIEVSPEREANALEVYKYIDGPTSTFSVYRAPYIMTDIISGSVSSMITKSKCDIDSSNGYDTLKSDMFYAAMYSANKNRTLINWEEMETLDWKCILSITGLYEEYNIEELEGPLDMLPGMDQYKFYSLETSYDAAGVVVLYPDHQTFAMLLHPFLLKYEDDPEDYNW